jgi:hypothetical protein
MMTDEQAQKSEIHETTEDASSAKHNPDQDAGKRKPGEIGDVGNSGASRPIKRDDVREPEEKLLGDDESSYGGPIDLDVPDVWVDEQTK